MLSCSLSSKDRRWRNSVH